MVVQGERQNITAISEQSEPRRRMLADSNVQSIFAENKFDCSRANQLKCYLRVLWPKKDLCVYLDFLPWNSFSHGAEQGDGARQRSNLLGAKTRISVGQG